VTADGPRTAVRFPVEGMTCSSCVGHITRALRKLDGVRGVRVDLRRELVTVEREPGKVPDASIAEAIEAAGYQPRMGDAVIVEPRPSFIERLLGH
jgi:Cu+-exporting ATPase